MMKFKIILLGLLVANNAMASLGYDSMFFIGNAIIFSNPYFEDNGVKLPINVDYILSAKTPELPELCGKFSYVSADQIKLAGADIGSKNGMLYDMKTDTFSPVPQPNTTFNSLDILMCQSDSYPVTPLGGVTTYLPDGSMKVDHPTVTMDGVEYPITMYVDFEVDELCKVLGYSKARSVQYSYAPRNPSIKKLQMNLFTNSYEIVLIPKLIQSKDEPFTVMDSITCAK